MFLIKTMKQLFLYITTLITLFSCSDEGLYLNDFFNQSQNVCITYPENIDQKSVIPEIAKYYENISKLAHWYARHPLSRNISPPLNPTYPVNTVLEKLQSILLVDSTGKRMSIFDLNEDERQNFLKSWQLVESHELSKKLKKDSSGISLGLFIDRNTAFKEALGNLKSVDIESEDPFFKVKAIMDEKEQKAIELQESPLVLKSEEYTDDNFWTSVVANNLLSFSIIQFAPNKLSTQTFIDHLRPNIQKGRILIALPGGWSTSNLLVLYANKAWYDVGHVAFITKNREEISDSIDDQYNFTIGTGVKGTLREEVGWAWCYKHGMAFMGQVCQVKWEIYKNSKNDWRVRKVTTDADNESIVKEIDNYLNVPYCKVIDVFFSKWLAPESFICSSLAWYLVKENTGLNISDWWSPTVFPRDLFFSENIRIVDDTLD